MHDVRLTGCWSTPLLSYLKVLGVFRLVAEQADPDARLWWTRGGHPMLRSRLDVDSLATFFLDKYQPSPITSPWNGGAGYVDVPSHREAVDTLRLVEASTSPRTAAFREVIAAAHRVRDVCDPEVDKGAFLEAWRAKAPDTALDWLDAAAVLTDDGARMNPLLGSGGNDGRLDFSKVFIGCLNECVALTVPEDAQARDASDCALRAALLGVDDAVLQKFPVGQFQPATAGLTNSSSLGSEPVSAVNPWDVVLMFEGALCFTGGVGRRLGDQAALFPFTCTQRGVMRLGASLASGGDSDVRGEIWLPTWSAPTSFVALQRLLSEGRAQDDRRQARSGREMARATASLGVDRGIDAFERVVFAQRFGRNHVGVPAGSAAVMSRSAEVAAIRTADPWLARVRRGAKAPMMAALAALEGAEFDVTRGLPNAFERWFMSLRAVSDVAASLPALRETDSGVHPLDRLPMRLARLADDGSAEFRLAMALAAAGRHTPQGDSPDPVVRRILEPVAWDGRRLRWTTDVRCQPGLRRTPLAFLAHVASVAPAVDETGGARFSDIRHFLEGRVNPTRIVSLALCLALCEPLPSPEGPPARRPRGVSRAYSALYLATRAGYARRPKESEALKVPPRHELARLAVSAPDRAVGAAVTHLRACGLTPFHRAAEAHARDRDAHIVAAALAFPLRIDDRAAVEAAVLSPAAEPLQGAQQ